MGFSTNTITIIGQTNYWVDGLIIFLSVFLGFLSAVVIEKYKRWLDKKASIKKEHAHLERHFLDVRQMIFDNKSLIDSAIENYNNGIIDLESFDLIPIREDSTMKIEDILFINKMLFYTTQTRRLNRYIESTNIWKSKINDDFSSGRIEQAKKNLDNFSKKLKDFDNVFNYHLDHTNDMIAENRILLRRYNDFGYNYKDLKEKNDRRKELIKKEIELMNKERDKNNDFLNFDRIERSKKYGLYREDK